MKKVVITILSLVICLGICACGTNDTKPEPTSLQATAEATQAPTSEPTAVPTDAPTENPTAEIHVSPNFEHLNPLVGTWYEKSDEFGGKAITVSVDGELYSMFLWVQYAGGEFPAGNIVDFKFLSLDQLQIFVNSEKYTFSVTTKMIDENTLEINCPEFPEYDKTYVRETQA